MSWRPEVLVLGPGGMRGFLELGDLIALEKEKIINNTDKFVGVSVVTIIALHLVAGYKVEEIIASALETSIFEDVNHIDPPDILKFIEKWKGEGEQLFMVRKYNVDHRRIIRDLL